MNSDRISNWLTLGANIGVIVGIAFLVMEMRQNSDIATVQARLDYSAGWRAVDESRQDAAFAAVLAKSIETPESLSPVEVIQLDAYYWGVMDQMLSAKTASDTGLREDSYEHAADSVARLYFSNAFAQSWWEQARSALAGPAEREFVQVMDDVIHTRKQEHTVAPFQRLYQDLKASSEDAGF